MTPIEDKETSIDLVELYKKCEKDEALNCNRIDFDNLLKTSNDANQNSTENKNPTQQMKQDTKAEGTHCGHLIKWKRGEKLKESSHSIIWRALNIITGATLVVKQVKTRDLYDVRHFL